VFSLHHYDWYQNYATLSSFSVKAPLPVKEKLELAIIQFYGKASSIPENSSHHFGLQTSPFLSKTFCYHRSTANELLNRVHSAFMRQLKIDSDQFLIVDSPLIRENLTREFSSKTISCEADFVSIIDGVIAAVAKEEGVCSIICDLSDYANFQRIAPNDFKKMTISLLEKVIFERIESHLLLNPSSTIRSKSDLDDLTGIAFYAVIQHEERYILTVSHADWLIDRLSNVMSRSGFRLSPAHAREAWLSTSSLESILKEADILSIEGVKIDARDDLAPCYSLQDFFQREEVVQFQLLENEIDPPYLKVYAAATFKLLHGFVELELDKGFQSKDLAALLTGSYSRILGAMEKATQHKNTLVIFANQMELIYQEIQTWLLLLEPYQKGDELEKAVLANLSSSLPSCGKVSVYLKASGMRCFSSVLASLELQKGSRKLNVCVQKDSYYYETDETLKNLSSTYGVNVFDTDAYPDLPIKECFNKTPQAPFDLIIGEYHHNVSAGRRFYRKENLLNQIKTLSGKGMLSDQCVVLIDTTIQIEHSDDLKLLLNDDTIKALISNGKLSLVLLRSAQKFDMLGLDNYYGGIVTTVNEPAFFARFNQRMQDPLDQLKGLNYQGLTHLQKYAGREIDQFRQAIMDNTWNLFNQLPSQMVARTGNNNPIQVSRIEEKGQILLDLKFTLPNLKKLFFMALRNYTEANQLVCVMRPSFSFIYTTYIQVGPCKSRMTPGLEGIKEMELYGRFLNSFRGLLRGSGSTEITIRAIRRKTSCLMRH